jgi:hypothetical protein
VRQSVSRMCCLVLGFTSAVIFGAVPATINANQSLRASACAKPWSAERRAQSAAIKVPTPMLGWTHQPRSMHWRMECLPCCMIACLIAVVHNAAFHRTMW